MIARPSLPRSLPEAQGVSSAAILSFLDGIEGAISDLHSFMLLRHGTVVAEGWWSPYAPETPHMLFSLSKSFASTAVGLAVTEGRLSVDDTVLSFFPGEAPARVSPNLAGMKVRHLLTMTTGHEKDATDRTLKRGGHDAARAFLSIPVTHAPGTHFVYNTAATYMLSTIVQSVTGQTLVDYLTPRLFEPLGIRDVRWDSSLPGVDFGGFGLWLRTEDIARLGQLYLGKGTWNGTRILPEAWVAEATARQVSNGDAPSSDWSQGYGYQFWRCQPRGVYRGDGAFGQYCIVLPEQDAVIAITSGLGDMQAPLTRIWERLIPGIQAAASSPGLDADALAQRLSSLHYDPPTGAAASPAAAKASGVQYSFERTLLKITSIGLHFRKDACTLDLGYGRQRCCLSVGYGSWIRSRMLQPSQAGGVLETHPVAASGAWTGQDTFTVTIRQLDAPFVLTMALAFGRSGLTCAIGVNVGFGPKGMPTIKGRRIAAKPRTTTGKRPPR